jgi:Arc/MetJ-type ribon-helix-helix transcriptional regulator
MAHVVSSYHMNDTGTLKRTSMSLDQETLGALELLATKWNTSKSEVIRRAVRKVKEDEAMKGSRMTPIQAMEWLQENGISQEQANTMREEIRLEREARRYWWE